MWFVGRGASHLVLADIALTLILWGVVLAEHTEGCHKQGTTQNNSCPIQSNPCAFMRVQVLRNGIALSWYCLYAHWLQDAVFRGGGMLANKRSSVWHRMVQCNQQLTAMASGMLPKVTVLLMLMHSW